jgi:hypothetical protein
MGIKETMDRRAFLKVAGMALGTGVIYEFAPLLASRANASAITDFF